MKVAGLVLILALAGAAPQAQEPEHVFPVVFEEGGFEHTGWFGDFERGGNTYRLKIPFGPDLRHVDRPDQCWLFAGPGTTSFRNYVPLPRWVQLNGERFALSIDLHTDGGDRTYVASLTAAEATGTTCHFSGRDVTSLTLYQPRTAEDSILTVLDDLPTTVVLPPGDYRYTLVIGCLPEGERYGQPAQEETVSAVSPLIAHGGITVEPQGTTTVDLGPPLDNRITVRRIGSRLLEVDHALVGGEGEEYRLVRRTSGGLSFTVRCDGREVGGGRFRYG